MYARRKAGGERLNLLVNFVGDRECIAVRLPIDTDQHRGLSIGGDHGVHRSHRTRDSANVTHANGYSGAGSLHHNLAEFVGRMNLSADQAEHQLMIVFEEAGRIDEICFSYAVENVGNRHASGNQPRGIGSDLIFGHAAALNNHGSHAIQPVQSRLDIVGGHLPNVFRGNRIGGQAVTENWKCCESEAMRFQLPCVAYGSSAIPSTLGDEALVWGRLDPRVLAEALHYCIENREAGDIVVARQNERYEQRFSRSAIRSRFQDLLAPFLDPVVA